MSLPPRLPLALFVLYTGLLLTATHWPGLAIHGPIDRTDLVIHACVYLVWGVLLGLSGLVGRSLPRLLLVGVLFAALDETTQPLFRRTFDLTDLGADAFGVVLACFVMRWHWVRRGRVAGAVRGGAA